MSESKKETTERKPFVIELKEHVPFDGIASTKYITSSTFLHLTSVLFKSVFADFEGCVFEASGQGEPTVSLIFNHGKYGENDVVACERASGKAIGNAVVDRMRNRDRQMTEGDRYFLTEDGKDAFTPLIHPKYFKDGKPSWKSIISEWNDMTPQTYYTSYGNVPQYTKVSGLQLSKIAALLYGFKDDNSSSDDYFEYDVRIMGTLNGQFNVPMTRNANYLMTITKVSKAEVENVYRELGFGSVGSSIIRA